MKNDIEADKDICPPQWSRQPMYVDSPNHHGPVDTKDETKCSPKGQYLQKKNKPDDHWNSHRQDCGYHPICLEETHPRLLFVKCNFLADLPCNPSYNNSIRGLHTWVVKLSFLQNNTPECWQTQQITPKIWQLELNLRRKLLNVQTQTILHTIICIKSTIYTPEYGAHILLVAPDVGGGPPRQWTTNLTEVNQSQVLSPTKREGHPNMLMKSDNN